MNTRDEPRRLVDSADDSLAAADAFALRAEPPSRAQLDALAQRLAPQLASPTLAGAATTAVALWIKWLVGLSVALAVCVYVATRGARSVPAPQRAQPVGSRAAAPPSVVAAPAPEVPVAGPPAAGVESRETPVRPRTSARRAARDTAASVPAAAPAPENELLLLERSRAALDAEPRLALELAETHARSYPSGVFAQERELLAIEALLKLKRKAEARERAAGAVRAALSGLAPHPSRARVARPHAGYRRWTLINNRAREASPNDRRSARRRSRCQAIGGDGCCSDARWRSDVSKKQADRPGYTCKNGVCPQASAVSDLRGIGTDGVHLRNQRAGDPTVVSGLPGPYATGRR